MSGEPRDLRFEKVERAFRVSVLPRTQDPGPSFPIASRTCFRPVSHTEADQQNIPISGFFKSCTLFIQSFRFILFF